MSRKTVPGQVGRRIFAGVAAAGFSTLFLAPPALLPGAEVSPLLAFVGLTLPFSAAGLALALAEKRVERDLRRVRWVPAPEPRLRRHLISLDEEIFGDIQERAEA